MSMCLGAAARDPPADVAQVQTCRGCTVSLPIESSVLCFPPSHLLLPPSIHWPSGGSLCARREQGQPCGTQPLTSRTLAPLASQPPFLPHPPRGWSRVASWRDKGPWVSPTLVSETSLPHRWMWAVGLAPASVSCMTQVGTHTPALL